MAKNENELAEALAVVESEVSAIYSPQSVETYEEELLRKACEAYENASAKNWRDDATGAQWRKALEAYASEIGKSVQTASKIVSDSLR